MWSIVAGEVAPSWAERTGGSPNDSFNGLVSEDLESLPGVR
jgi:hypothetical protein